MRTFIIIFGLTVILSLPGIAQKADTAYYLGAIVVEGDTLPHINLTEVPVFPRKFNTKRQQQQYTRLVQRVKKVYPYAKLAGQLLREYDAKYRATNDPKLKKKYIKQAEDELFKKYGSQLKKLTISEGRILIKLIDRETEHTSYELIKDLKGGISAIFWQGIAKVFGNNLKDDYDPIVEDRLIEQIIFYIDTGVF